jgi:hypothetical protein
MLASTLEGFKRQIVLHIQEKIKEGDSFIAVHISTESFYDTSESLEIELKSIPWIKDSWIIYNDQGSKVRQKGFFKIPETNQCLTIDYNYPEVIAHLWDVETARFDWTASMQNHGYEETISWIRT